jgi:phage terminase Nu1 subunit (DNA packaging protein)
MAFPPKISTSDLSALLGVTERAITRLVAKGILRKDSFGTFDVVDVVQAFIQHREASVAERYGKGAFGEARAELYVERGRIARIQRQELEGQLIPAGEARAAFSTVFGMLRAMMLAVPSRTAPHLVGLKSAAQAKSIVKAAVNEAMVDIQERRATMRWIEDGKDSQPQKAARP